MPTNFSIFFSLTLTKNTRTSNYFLIFLFFFTDYNIIMYSSVTFHHRLQQRLVESFELHGFVQDTKKKMEKKNYFSRILFFEFLLNSLIIEMK